MHLRWSRAVVALLIVGGTAALGVGALGVGTAAAATCGLAVCPPINTAASLSPGDNGGATAIKTKWTLPSNAYHVDSFQVTVTWTGTGAPPDAPRPGQTTWTSPLLDMCQPVVGTSQECEVAWPPELENNGFVLNGMYSVSATARACDNLTGVICSQPTTTAPATAAVGNPPTAPGNVKATVVTSPANAVNLTWDPSPEPDVFAYSVRRSGNATPIGGCRLSFAPPDLNTLPVCPPSLSVTDSSSGGGDFTYTVSAIRYGGTYAYANRVETAAVSKKVTVAGPPSTTVAGGGTGTTPGGGAGFGVFNAPKVKPGSAIPTIGLSPKALAGAATATTVDPGFSQVLPYGPTTDTTAKPTVAAGPVVPAPKGKSSVKSIALVGAGVLITVIAMHGLWLRSEVRRSGALEVLEPEL